MIRTFSQHSLLHDLLIIGVNGKRSGLSLQWVPELLEHLELFHVNKSCKIECCVNKMHQIIQNMTFSQGLELELSMFRTILYQVSIPLGTGPKF